MSEGCLGHNIQYNTEHKRATLRMVIYQRKQASSESYTGPCQEARNISGGVCNVCLLLPDMGATVPAFL